MWDVEVIDDPAAAVVALDPVRARLLAELAQPGSASTLAAKLGVARQKVNYHLRTLEAHGLVRLVEERRKGGLRERMLRATAASYVVSPAALGDAASDPARSADRLSARYLVALAARVVREVAEMLTAADRAGKRLPVLALDTEIRFRSAAERTAFAADLAAAVTGLAARYHDAAAPDGRSYRLVVAAHPLPAPAGPEPAAQEPAVQEPAAQEPAAQEPAAQEPAAQEPAAQEPAAQEPAAPPHPAHETQDPPEETP